MTGPLLTVGRWLSASGAGIFGTRPWFLSPVVSSSPSSSSSSPPVRFTTTPDAFYIVALAAPAGDVLTVHAPVPAAPGDTVRVLGGSGRALPWRMSAGVFEVEIDGEPWGVEGVEVGVVEVRYA